MGEENVYLGLQGILLSLNQAIHYTKLTSVRVDYRNNPGMSMISLLLHESEAKPRMSANNKDIIRMPNCGISCCVTMLI